MAINFYFQFINKNKKGKMRKIIIFEQIKFAGFTDQKITIFQMSDKKYFFGFPNMKKLIFINFDIPNYVKSQGFWNNIVIFYLGRTV